MSFSIKLNPKLLDEVNASASNLWTPPSDATHKGDSRAWTDIVTILSSTTEQDADNPQRQIVRVTFECAPESTRTDGHPNPNIGRRHTEWLRVAPAAMTDSGHSDRKMTVISVGVLKNLARSAGLLADGDDSTDFGYLFDGDAQSPLTGTKVFGRVRQYKDKNGIPRQSIDRYQPLE